MIGTKLAHFTITAHLGSGGMGEVYQATDSKLGRSVAIKLLPEAFTHDTERAARFEREARVLASLNHSNIAAIYGIEQSGERKFLVMELVSGETLAERIKRGPIPIDEALPIAKQIADGLEAAHEKGIIHRDLKPANIKITPQGQVKVLDFGLAKAFAGEAGDVNLSNSPTMMSATTPGMIIGTAAYMSPEQAKGKETDRATDIWAFGCVLYEMLTGSAAFDGETLAEILGGVIKAEPDWSRLPAGTPAAIQRLLRRALKKDPRQRLGDIRDARIEIEEVGTETETALPQPKGRERFAWIAALVVALALGASALVFRTPVVDAPETRVEITTPATEDPASFAISPDGRRVVFVASGEGQARLWLRSLDRTNAQPLAGTEGATQPFWSPDGKSIGFFATNALKRIDVNGGAAQKLADASNGLGGAWSTDGTILFAPGYFTPLVRIAASGGRPTPATKVDAPRQTTHRFPQFLPDGRRFLFYAAGTPDAAGIYLGSMDSPETKLLTPADTAGLYLQPGWLLFIRQGTLLARRFDPVRGELTGDPATVADQVTNNGYLGAFSVAVSGAIAYRTGGTNRRQLMWFDRSGKVLGTLGAPDESSPANPRVSPDGRRVAVSRRVQGNTDIYLLDGTREDRFTFDAAADQSPVWSPDGSRILFDSSRKGHRDIYQKPSTNAGAEELLVESDQTKIPNDWSADGRFILYLSFDLGAAESQDLWVKPMEGDRTPWVFLKTSVTERSGQFSPNGHWVAYMSNESGRMEICIRPFSEPTAPGVAANPSGGQRQVSTAGGLFPRWRADGKELYYIGLNGEMMATPITVTETALEYGAPVALFPTRIFGGGLDAGQPRQYDVSRDGRFLINTVLDDASSPITLLMNWSPEPKK